MAPIVGTGFYGVVFAAIFLGRGELVGRRLFVVALLVVAGSTLVGATRRGLASRSCGLVAKQHHTRVVRLRPEQRQP